MEALVEDEDGVDPIFRFPLVEEQDLEELVLIPNELVAVIFEADTKSTYKSPLYVPKKQFLPLPNGMAEGTCTCALCFKTFETIPKLNTHFCNCHNQLYKCQYCEKEFKAIQNLQRHERTHKQEKPFKCKKCEYRSSQPSNLQQHINTVHLNIRSFSCDICEYNTNKKERLEYHINAQHLKLKPFKCHACDYATANRANLSNHKRIHSDEKEFKCNICEFGCHQKANLKKHLRRHTNEAKKQTPTKGKTVSEPILAIPVKSSR